MKNSPSLQYSLLFCLLRFALLLYVSLAIFYTSTVLFSPVLHSALNRLPGDYTHLDPSLLLDDLLGSFPFGWRHHRGPVTMPNTERVFGNHSDDVIYWDPPASNALSRAFSRHNMNYDTSMSADLFLSKAFAVSHEHLAHANTRGLDIVPYYYRASASPDSEDVTITTLVTRDRFVVFRELVEHYQGPVSVTVHVSRAELEAPASNEMNFLDALHTLYASTPLMARLVDVHLVLTPARADRQFNAWRNVARLFARTAYVMMLDVDFVPCTDFRGRLRAFADGPVKALLRQGAAALVVPAFEYVRHEDGAVAQTFPKTKEELVALYNASRIDMFHAGWAPGHNSTDYARMLFQAAPGEVYRVPRAAYQHAYEPYVIFRRDAPGMPWCDERFVGYGGNKAACLYEMYLSGVSFYVLADDFLVHRSHAYDERARRRERRVNRKIYADFREEVCLRYLMAFRDAGELGQEKAWNAVEECKKVKGIARIAAMILEGH